jgi:tetratricopeptide (TPR) repeat protein
MFDTRGHSIRAALAALALSLASCSSADKTGDTRDSFAEYQSGRYEPALAKAKLEAQRMTGADRQRARFVAGMSAYQLKQDDEALRYLTAVTGEDDPSIAGPAAATAGLIYTRTGYHAKAVTYFQQAVKLLKGNDQAQATYHLAAAQQRLGQWSDARVNLERALSSASDAELREAIRKRLLTSGYTIQLGAYSDRKNADQQAIKAQSQIQKAGLGSPRVVVSSALGKTLYLVQVGQYPTYDAAMKARQALGRIDAAVTELKTP